MTAGLNPIWVLFPHWQSSATVDRDMTVDRDQFVLREVNKTLKKTKFFKMCKDTFSLSPFSNDGT